MVTDAEKRRVGALIRHRRQALDLSQDEFARLVGRSRNSVSKVENGLSYPVQWAGKAEAVLGIRLADDPPPDQNEAVLQNSIDGLDAAQLAKLVEAYRAIRNGGPRPPRERAG